MKKKNFCNLIITSGLFLSFLILTLLIKFVNVKSIGPENSTIGLSDINTSILQSIKSNLIWDKIADILMLFALCVALCIAVIGVVQLIKRKKILKVDKEILILGIIYILVIGFYILFEIIIINYRPILIDGKLEASFPSSHTLIVTTILSTSLFYFYKIVSNKIWRAITTALVTAIIIIATLSRLLAGVHWFTDIIGALLLSASLFMLYKSLLNHFQSKEQINNKDNLNE